MRKVLMTALAAMSLSGSLMAAQGAEERIRTQLQKLDSQIPIESIIPAQVQGMYEVTLGNGDTLFADAKGEYFVVGQLYRYTDEHGFQNLSEQKAATLRARRMAEVADADKVVYAPAGAVKATINVFTDPTCPYCRKLHEEVKDLNAMGVQVNYLAYPRAGFGSAAYKDMQSVWCQPAGKPRADAMNTLKTGGKLERESCTNPIMDQMALGQQMGVNGTPAMVFEDGTLVPGYIPADRLAQMLKIH